MKFVTGINRLARPKSLKESAAYIRKIRTYDMKRSYARMEQAKRTKQLDDKLKSFDERYALIVNGFMNELSKRKISINEPNLDNKIDEILSSISEGKYFQSRFADDDMKDIKNAVLRRVNTEKQKIVGEER